jgi:hypothetical protein
MPTSLWRLSCTLLQVGCDFRGQQTRHPEVYASDRYDASQKLGEDVRASGGAGLLYDGLRRQTGVYVVAHRPRNITDIVQTDHFRNYCPGNVADDRRPQTVALIELLTAGTATPPVLANDRFALPVNRAGY